MPIVTTSAGTSTTFAFSTTSANTTFESVHPLRAGRGPAPVRPERVDCDTTGLNRTQRHAVAAYVDAVNDLRAIRYANAKYAWDYGGEDYGQYSRQSIDNTAWEAEKRKERAVELVPSLEARLSAGDD